MVILQSFNYPSHRLCVEDRERVTISEAGGSVLQVVPALFRQGDQRGAHSFDKSAHGQFSGQLVSLRRADGRYLRHCGYKLRSHCEEDSALFRLDASFYMLADAFRPRTVSFLSPCTG